MTPISIEKLVRWCVVDEWPKERAPADRERGMGSGWGATASYVELLTVVDENRYGVVPDVGGVGDVHPDAVVVGEALRRLCADGGPILAEIDPAWLVGDLVWRVGERQGDEAARAALDWLMPRAIEALGRVVEIGVDGARRAKVDLDRLVVRAALLGAPVWRMDLPTWGQVKRPNGTLVWRRKVRRAVDWNEDGDAIRWVEIEVDVPSPAGGGRRPVDAYPAMAATPFDGEALVERARYVLWQTTLRALAAGVDGRLADHAVIADAVSMPWIGRQREGRVLVTEVGRGRLDVASRRRGSRGL